MTVVLSESERLIYSPEPPPIIVVRTTDEITPSQVAFQKDSRRESSRFAKSGNISLITQERTGKTRKFVLGNSISSAEASQIPIDRVEVVEVIADRQEYDEFRQVITAEGKVVLRFAQSVMTSDRLEVNLADRIVVAEGDVVLKRGEQIIRGQKFEYYLVQDRGVVFNANGEIYQPSLRQDLNLATRLPEAPTIANRALSDRLTDEQPITEVTSAGGLEATVGSSRGDIVSGGTNQGGGTVKRLRFQADRLDFEPESWKAVDFRLTNDPFSPPELEVRADIATFDNSDRDRSQLKTENSRIVLDDRISLPLFVRAFVFDNRDRQPALFNFGFDGEERGGLYIERGFSIIATDKVRWTVTPQYFLQRALIPTAFRFSQKDEGGLFNASVFGLKNQFNVFFSNRTTLESKVAFTSFDTEDIEDNLRAKIIGRHFLGDLENPHSFSLEYNFRERLFNGSLGFRTVYNSFGGVVASPRFTLGDTGINLRYQGSIQNINAETDRGDLLAAERENDRVNLTRYQGAAFLNKSFSLWQGEALPSTKNEGLRYTPVPVVPYLQLNTGVSGVSSFYSNGDTQLSLRGEIGIQGQLGHFSRSWLDYTGFKLGYSQSIRGDASPFLFDRDVDRKTVSFGIVQQVYGPLRLGVQTSFDLDDSDPISTDYMLEYSRRTYNVVLRYNPVLELGSFSIRISDFNWRGNSQPFEDNDVTPVIQGVGR
ncbi:MAG: DUF3769 domain-containing protein [Pleurocapsa sp.]